MVDSVEHTLNCWGKLVLNTPVDLTMMPKPQGCHGALLLLIRIANEALYLCNSDLIHAYPLNTLSRVMPLWKATVTGSRNCSSA